MFPGKGAASAKAVRQDGLRKEGHCGMKSTSKGEKQSWKGSHHADVEPFVRSSGFYASAMGSHWKVLI